MMTCHVDGCNRYAEVKGVCIMHYSRKRRTGSYVNKLKHLIDFKIDENGCFNCTSHAGTSAGYPIIKRGSKSEYIHRFIYRECFGDIPRKKVIRHRCDNPKCINPEHLNVGTQADNVRDMVERGRNCFGEKNVHSKLTVKEVEWIKVYLSKKGESTSNKIRFLSDKYNVHVNTIYDIYYNRTWKSVKINA